MKIRHNFRSATYVFLFRANQVLLARRFNTGYKDGQYSTMAGHVEPNESIIDCAIREVQEEARVAVDAKDLQLFHVMTRYSDHDYIDFFFSCEKWNGNPIIGEPQFCDDLSWFNLDTLPNNAIDYIREVLKYYKNGEMFSKYGW